MRPGANGELILEGQTEARVAAQILTNNGLDAAVGMFEPPIDKPHIGRLEFLFRRAITDRIGPPDTTEHVINHPVASELGALAISVAASPSFLSILLPNVVPSGLTRKSFLASRVRGFWQEVNQILRARMPEQEHGAANTGYVMIVGLSPEHAEWLEERKVIVLDYCREKGWDPNDLNPDQITEIRNLDALKSPPEQE